MSKLILTVAGALATSFALADAAIDSVQVWQDWPWSRNVNVKVVISGAGEAGVDIRLSALNDGDGICEIFDGLFQVEKVKDADSFSEVPDIYLAVASFKAAEKKGLFAYCREAPRIVEKLIERKI